MGENDSLHIHNLLRRVYENTSGIFKRDSELICTLPDMIARIIGDRDVYLSEFVLAKVKGKIKGFSGHPKITDEIIYKLPQNLSNPYKILKETRKIGRKEYLFMNIDPLHQIAVEVERRPSGHTEINTIFDTTPSELKRLEGKLPILFSSGETPTSRIRASKQ